MIIYPMAEQGIGSRDRAGAIPGQQHLKPLLDQLGSGPGSDEPGMTVLLDMKGVETVTASYLKATFLYLLRRAGALELGVLRSLERGSERTVEARDPAAEVERAGEDTLNIFPMVAGLSPDVREELDDLLLLRKLSALEVMELEESEQAGSERILQARLRGVSGGIVADTLKILMREGEATASQLFERHGGGINVTGWNNRLADLHRLRLARRRKEGRFWIYRPVAEEIIQDASGAFAIGSISEEVLHG